MIDLPTLSLDMARALVQNFAIIAALLLFYYFIPDSLRSRSQLAYSLCVGIVFGITAAISIPALWQDTGGPVVGFNFILVPLAGVIGGPVSTVFVAIVLLGGSTLSNGSVSNADVLTIMSGILLGALFYSGQSRIRLPESHRARLLLLGIGVALIELIVLISVPVQSAPGTISNGSRILDTLPFIIISCMGTVLLGSIIGAIDRKKQAERELVDYKDHLEALVKARTAELRLANSLQKATFNATADAILVLDSNNALRAYNQRALRMLNLPPHPADEPEMVAAFEQSIHSLLADPDGLLRMIRALPESAEQVVTSDLRFKDGRICEIFVQPERLGDRIVGRVFSLRDITDRQHAEEAIAAANNKLILLANISRHDILNQMTAACGYLSLARNAIHDPPVAGYLDTMQKSMDVIRLQVEFSRDYQDLGIQKPVWQNVTTAFGNAAEQFADSDIHFQCGTGTLEIFTDPLIERVFYNLIDNSIRHGERITEIRLVAITADPDMVLVYEDNGVGVLPEEKEKIFNKGFGKHTGLGMFLIREILSITGMSIQETGTYGSGVRFEINVPSGKFRAGP